MDADSRLKEIWNRIKSLCEDAEKKPALGRCADVPGYSELVDEYNELAEEHGKTPLGWASPRGGWATAAWIEDNFRFASRPVKVPEEAKRDVSKLVNTLLVILPKAVEQKKITPDGATPFGEIYFADPYAKPGEPPNLLVNIILARIPSLAAIGEAIVTTPWRKNVDETREWDMYVSTERLFGFLERIFREYALLSMQGVREAQIMKHLDGRKNSFATELYDSMIHEVTHAVDRGREEPKNPRTIPQANPLLAILFELAKDSVGKEDSLERTRGQVAVKLMDLGMPPESIVQKLVPRDEAARLLLRHKEDVKKEAVAYHQTRSEFNAFTGMLTEAIRSWLANVAEENEAALEGALESVRVWLRLPEKESLSMEGIPDNAFGGFIHEAAPWMELLKPDQKRRLRKRIWSVLESYKEGLPEFSPYRGTSYGEGWKKILESQPKAPELEDVHEQWLDKAYGPSPEKPMVTPWPEPEEEPLVAWVSGNCRFSSKPSLD